MRRFGNWAVALATLMAMASVGIKAMSDPAAGKTTPAATAAITVAARPSPVPMAPAKASPASAQQAPASGYVGAETCVGCHRGLRRERSNATKHGFSATAARRWPSKGCESCHGPGEAHANDPEKVKPIQLNKVAADGRQRPVPDLPQPRRARAVGRQPARQPQRRVRATATACTPARDRALMRAKTEHGDLRAAATRPSPTSSSASTTCPCARAR